MALALDRIGHGRDQLLIKRRRSAAIERIGTIALVRPFGVFHRIDRNVRSVATKSPSTGSPEIGATEFFAKITRQIPAKPSMTMVMLDLQPVDLKETLITGPDRARMDMSNQAGFIIGGERL